MTNARPKPNDSGSPSDTLSWRVTDYFRAHPAEVLTPRDIAKKFDVAPSSVDTMLMPAVQAGHLARGQSDEYGVIYRLPANGGKQPHPFMNTPQARKSLAKRQAAFRMDFSKIVIEKDIPLADPYVRRAPWPKLFDRMEVGDSVRLPKEARAAVAHAMQSYRKKPEHQGKDFKLRLMDEVHVRVWRTA